MLQLEVVERLAAQPGSKEWGRLGVLTQLQCEVEKLFEVRPRRFIRHPKSSRQSFASLPGKHPLIRQCIFQTCRGWSHKRSRNAARPCAIISRAP